jgi:hypothetical protein
MTIFPVDSYWRLYQKAASRCGAVAQLGERLNGIQEVRGSIPRSSTTYTLEKNKSLLECRNNEAVKNDGFFVCLWQIKSFMAPVFF